jgi:hypothetical protein
MRTTLAILAATALTAATASAVSVTINNPGFETDLAAAQAGGGWTDAVPTGWSDPAGPENSNFLEVIAGFASEGQVHLGFDPNENGTVYQDLATPWAPNTVYTLTVGVGNRGGFGAGIGRFGFGSSTDPAPPALTQYTPSVFSQDLNTLTIAPADNTFGDATFVFTTGAVAPAGNIRISVQEISATRIHVDNFRLDATVIPEPSSASTLAMAAGLLRRRRR